MLPESLVPADKAQPDHSASGCNPRRPQPFGRAIEVFVASRMMMRIIETPLLKGKSDILFAARKVFLSKDTLTNWHQSGCPSTELATRAWLNSGAPPSNDDAHE
jgi:hypothetical protein